MRMQKIADHAYSRKRAVAYGMVLGVVAGVLNTFYPLIDFAARWSLFGWLVAAVVTVICVHEGVHGIVAALFGHRPLFGIKPPFFYVTFDHKIPRGRFILITLAPLVVLDVVFAVLFALGVLRVYMYFCLLTNTIGAMGDIWLTVMLLPHARGTLVQDTKNGVEVWQG
ncbi:MAG: DUF3267 domain-containing protein [Kiritimatiellae bacterium]|nr:DUF3267 domain-containing protein [Kiritimatiellia bacterium]